MLGSHTFTSELFLNGYWTSSQVAILCLAEGSPLVQFNFSLLAGRLHPRFGSYDPPGSSYAITLKIDAEISCFCLPALALLTTVEKFLRSPSVL